VKPHLEKVKTYVGKVWTKVAGDERVKVVGVKVREVGNKVLKGGKKAWEQGRPLVVKGWKEGRKQWRETVVPMAKKAYRLVRKHGYNGGVKASR